MTELACIDEAGFDRLRALLARTRVAYEVVHEGGAAAWAALDADRPFAWDTALPLEGIKHFFLPDGEPLLRWQGEVVTEVRPETRPLALVGVRPCDAVALAYQDRFFAEDPYYRARRDGALIVATSCSGACARGFCAEVDAGPHLRDGFDLGLTRLGRDAIALAVGSTAGADVLAAAAVATRPLDATYTDRLEGARRAALASFPDHAALRRGLARVAAQPGVSPVHDDEWQRLGPLCFACSGCTTLCPTCSCFTIADEVRGDGGVRRRLLDSCLLEGFQREASGHNPSARPGDRVRRFWTHKLGASFAHHMGRPGCVGCGRCDVTCPGSIGARAVLSQLGGQP